MASLPLRRVDIDFSGVPFLWHPARPRLGAALNGVSFAAVAFERELCAAFKEALPAVSDPHLAGECRRFVAQEATHSRLHRAHCKALVAQTPALRGVASALEALAQRHLDGLPLLERVGIGAAVEGALAPVGRFMVAERERLFAEADVRVAALFLWHFSEEIEHRSTALKLFRHMRDAQGAPKALRLRATVRAVRMLREGAALLRHHFRAAPGFRGGVPELPLGPALGGLALGLSASVLPGHDAGGRAMPPWAQHFLSRIQRGEGPVEAWVGRADGVERSRVVGA